MDAPHGRDLRKGRYSESGQIYLLTTVTYRRRPVFAEPACARCVIRAMRRESLAGNAQTIAFVVMPDHLHWLVQLERGSLAALMARMKSGSALLVARTLYADGAPCRVWQRGFHDHAMRDEESLVAAARYIVANPLRAGLCTKVGDYPHWDAAWLHSLDHLP